MHILSNILLGKYNMSFCNEFSTIDVLKASCAETRGVDAFSLSLIKAERQIRKLVTHLVFQYPCFTRRDISSLRDQLATNNKVYFKGMIRGFDVIYPKTVKELIGDNYQYLQDEINDAAQYRNKIFHGQLTNKRLSRNDLFSYVNKISEWCCLLAEGAEKEIGYDGFARNSFQKSKYDEINKKFKVEIKSIKDYEIFIRKNMQRTNQGH